MRYSLKTILLPPRHNTQSCLPIRLFKRKSIQLLIQFTELIELRLCLSSQP